MRAPHGQQQLSRQRTASSRQTCTKRFSWPEKRKPGCGFSCASAHPDQAGLREQHPQHQAVQQRQQTADVAETHLTRRTTLLTAVGVLVSAPGSHAVVAAAQDASPLLTVAAPQEEGSILGYLARGPYITGTAQVDLPWPKGLLDPTQPYMPITITYPATTAATSSSNSMAATRSSDTTNPSASSSHSTDSTSQLSPAHTDQLPLVVFCPGFLVDPSAYSYQQHLASWGYVVASVVFPRETPLDPLPDATAAALVAHVVTTLTPDADSDSGYDSDSDSEAGSNAGDAEEEELQVVELAAVDSPSNSTGGLGEAAQQLRLQGVSTAPADVPQEGARWLQVVSTAPADVPQEGARWQLLPAVAHDVDAAAAGQPAPLATQLLLSSSATVEPRLQGAPSEAALSDQRSALAAAHAAAAAAAGVVLVGHSRGAKLAILAAAALAEGEGSSNSSSSSDSDSEDEVAGAEEDPDDQQEQQQLLLAKDGNPAAAGEDGSTAVGPAADVGTRDRYPATARESSSSTVVQPAALWSLADNPVAVRAAAGPVAAQQAVAPAVRERGQGPAARTGVGGGRPQVVGLGLLDPVDLTYDAPVGATSALPAFQQLLQGDHPSKVLVVGAGLNSDCIPRRSNYSAFAAAAAAASSCGAGAGTGGGGDATSTAGNTLLMVVEQAGHLQFLDEQTTLQRSACRQGKIDEAAFRSLVAGVVSWAFSAAGGATWHLQDQQQIKAASNSVGLEVSIGSPDACSS